MGHGHPRLAEQLREAARQLIEEADRIDGIEWISATDSTRRPRLTLPRVAGPVETAMRQASHKPTS